MKNLFIILVAVFSSMRLFAQIEKDSLLLNSKTTIDYIQNYQVNYNFNSFRINPETMFLNINSEEIIPNSMIWTGTRMSISGGNLPYGIGMDSKADILQPYYNFYIESKNISLFRKVLGMAQLGAVGYLAYQHIKKYGLFHQP